MMSPPVRGAWIEIDTVNVKISTAKSPPVRGAWIEILYIFLPQLYRKVASREGGVD